MIGLRPEAWGSSGRMLTDHQPLIINVVRHLAGAIVFGIFLFLTLRGSPGRRLRQNGCRLDPPVWPGCGTQALWRRCFRPRGVSIGS